MDNLEHDLDEVGRGISPDLHAARHGIADRAGAQPTRSAGVPPRPLRAPWLRSAAITAALACALAAALGTTIALRHTGSPAQQAPAVALPAGSGTSTSASATASGAPLGVSDATAPATTTPMPVTIQPLHTYPPYTATASSSAAASRSAPIAGGDVVITMGTAGPVQVRRGQTVEVDLPASSPAWGEPQTSNPSVLALLSGSTSPDGSAHALFRAVTHGSASVVSAQAPPACSAKCLPALAGWEVTVSVVG